MGRVRKFLSLSRSEKLAFFEAGVLLLLATLGVRTIAFKYIERFLRRRWSEAPRDHSDQSAVTRHVAQAVSRAETVWPWRSRCLSRSIATFVMLRRRGIPAVLFTGVRISEDTALHAHAWVGTDDWTRDRAVESAGYTTLVRIGANDA